MAINFIRITEFVPIGWKWYVINRFQMQVRQEQCTTYSIKNGIMQHFISTIRVLYIPFYVPVVDHDIWDSLPRALETVDEIALFLKVLQKYEVCAANYDSDFHILTSEFSALTNPRFLQISAYRKGDIGAICNTLRYKSAIRASN